MSNTGDAMIKATQNWLNDTYGNNPGYNKIEVDGYLGWGTIYALTRALQIELGIQNTADSFGPTSQKLFQTISRKDGVKDNKFAIVQGALWCKGYNTGHYGVRQKLLDEVYHVDNEFDASVEKAVIKMKTDAGMPNPNGDVTVGVMKALLSMDYFMCIPEGNPGIRIIQQMLNRNYMNYIGLMPCDGVFCRSTNKALIYALQAEEGLPTTVANGNIGTTTKKCCPSIPYMGKELNYANKPYTNDQISNIVKVLQMALNCNGFSCIITGNYDDGTKQAVNKFQKTYVLSETENVNMETWLSLLVSCGDINRKALACDCATILTEPTAITLVNNGYEVVGRYLSGTIAIGTSKALSVEELKVIFKSGLRVFPIYQRSANKITYFTNENALTDATYANNFANNFGIPSGTTIYFAIDFDATTEQIKNSLEPYFKELFTKFTSLCGGKYNVGIYGTRNVCQQISNSGYAKYSFVSDMSTGYSGNLGFKIPDNWAFDQFHTTTIGADAGKIEIDKDAYSGRDNGFNTMIETIHDRIGNDNLDRYPDILINCGGSSIPVYASKSPGYSGDGTEEGDIRKNYYTYGCSGGKIGEIHPGETYTRHQTGYIHTADGSNRRITVGDYVHRVVFRDANGHIREGYIQEHLDLIFYNEIDSSLPYQERFDYFNYDKESDSLKNTSSQEFKVMRPLKYFDKDGNYLGILEPNRIIKTNQFSSHRKYPWLMAFKWIKEENEWKCILPDSNAYVEIGYQYGSIGSERALW